VSSTVIACVGWLATAVFVASYLLTRPLALRVVQMLGAALWLLYGVLLGAPPVIVANALVMAAAGWTAVRALRQSSRPL
jgi:uncharacterized protein with PQ loop repeat